MRKDEAFWAVEDLKRQGMKGYVDKAANHPNGYAVVVVTGEKERRFFDREEVKAFLRGVA